MNGQFPEKKGRSLGNIPVLYKEMLRQQEEMVISNMVNLLDVLKKEVVPAEGCTEPIAVAYAVSLAAELVQEEITSIQLFLSGNIIKNAMG